MNLAALLAAPTARYADDIALRCGERWTTYAELDESRARFASTLVDRGLGRRDRVAILMKNSIEYATALLGTFSAGLTAVPINAKLHPREASWIVADAGARILVTDSSEVQAPTVIRRGSEWQATLAMGEPAFPIVDVDPSDLAWLFYTSGTTGFPKGAMLSHRNLMAMSMSCLADVCDFRADDIVLHAAPLSHGCGLYMLPALARGAQNLIYEADRFEAAEVLGVIERERVTTISFLAPTQVVRLLEADDSYDTSSLRRIVYGGGPIHIEHARAALDRFGPILCQIYGQGEAPMTISALKAEDHDEESLASAGFPRTGVEVRLLDEEILVRGDVVMSGYWNNPSATAQSLRGGWLHTGDLGRTDSAGRLFLLDRKHDTIISGGSNIYPREVEDVLVQHPQVREACVLGIPESHWGEIVLAVVVPANDQPDPEDLVSFCRTHLAAFKKPQRVEFVDALPKNAYGKVLRRELRHTYSATSQPGPTS